MMKKFLALLVSVVLLFGLLASFPSAGSDETGSATNENSVSYENSLETPDEGSNEGDAPELYNNVLNIIKVAVDKDGKPYSGDPDKEFTVHVSGPREYERTVKLKANTAVSLTDLPSGTFEVREEMAEGYRRIDDNGSITFTANYEDRHFPDDATAALGKNRDGSPVGERRDDVVAAMVDEGYGDNMPFPDGTFLSLGIGGVATFEFDRPFYNGPDVDLGIGELTWKQDESYEYAMVEAGKNGTDGWVTLGYINGDSAGTNGDFYMFDMGELDWARYIRITDLSNRIYLNRAMVSNTTGGSASYEVSGEVPDTTGGGVYYSDPDDGIDIDYVCTRYIGEEKSVEILNQRAAQDEPPVVNPPVSNPTPSEPSVEYHTLTTAVSGQGTILPGPGATSFPRGDTVQLKPEPAAGWEFDRWQGDAVDEKNQIYIDGNKSVTAVFRQIAPAQPETPEPTEPAESNEPALTVTEEPTLMEGEEQASQEEAAPAVETIEEEEPPTALPKTGGISALFFLGTGGALILAGIAAGRKRK